MILFTNFSMFTKLAVFVVLMVTAVTDDTTPYWLDETTRWDDDTTPYWPDETTRWDDDTTPYWPDETTRWDGLPCSGEQKQRCRVEVEGNNCTNNGQISQCECKGEGFGEADRRTRCERTYCTKSEEELCHVEYGNDCDIRNEKSTCRCYYPFEPVDGWQRCMMYDTTPYWPDETTRWDDDTTPYWPDETTRWDDDTTPYWPDETTRWDDDTTPYWPDETSRWDDDTTPYWPDETTRWDDDTSPWLNDDARSEKESKCYGLEDKMACRTELKGNSCRRNIKSGRWLSGRQCTCNAPGYIAEPIFKSRCWRIGCTKDQRHQCHTEVLGNKCRVTGDEHRCICKARGYQLSTSNLQSCIYVA